MNSVTARREISTTRASFRAWGQSRPDVANELILRASSRNLSRSRAMDLALACRISRLRLLAIGATPGIVVRYLFNSIMIAPSSAWTI